MKQRSISAVICFLSFAAAARVLPIIAEASTGRRCRRDSAANARNKRILCGFETSKWSPRALRVTVNGKQWSTLQIQQDAMLGFVVPTMASA